MIYVNNDTESITIPNLLGIDSSNYRLVLHNNVTNEEFIIDASNDSDNELYYSFVLDTSSMSQNEYTVSIDAYDTLNEDWIFIGKFLVQKGIADASISSFESNQEYISFEP